MWRKECTCPPFGDRSFEELVIFFGLRGKKEESKNCCEHLGWICPNLDRALVEAKKKDKYRKRVSKDNSTTVSLTPSRRKGKEVTKRELVL